MSVYLVDGSGYIFRAFYAVPHLTTREGFPTNALFGFSRMLLKLLSSAGSEHVVVAFDAGRKTFRNDLYPEYKANREECPEDLKKQMPYFRELCRLLGLQVLELPGFEADDIIATLADRLERQSIPTVIVSGDKDLMQLVDQHVSIWDTLKDKHYGPAEVREKFGVPPDKVVEFLGLTGDDSDNVPGLDGVGPKTAAQLIEKFGSVESVLAHAKDIRSDTSIRNRTKIADQIELNADLLRLSRKLVEVSKDTPVMLHANGSEIQLSSVSGAQLLAALRREAPHLEKIQEFASRFEFHSLPSEVSAVVPSQESTVAPPEEPCTVVYQDTFDTFAKQLAQQPCFAFDVETTSLNVLDAKLISISFAWDEHEAFYIPVAHESGARVADQVSLRALRTVLGPIFANPKIAKCGQNIKYDFGILLQQGFSVSGLEFDSMIASYLLRPDRRGHDLTVLTRDYLGKGLIEYETILGGAPDLRTVPIEAAARYGCQDARLAWCLRQKLLPMLAEKGLVGVLKSIEMPLVPILSAMERRGVLLDLDYLAQMSEEFQGKLDELRVKIFAAAGMEFNLNSPKQLADVLFVKLALPTKGIRKTKTGISTDSAVLEKLSPLHPVADLLLQHRLLFKLKSTYIDALPAQVSAIDGRLHTSFNQVGTGTGRLSSSEPNLQNIPILTPEGVRIRKAFVASERRTLVSADYSQIELRVLAHMSGDENLLAAFRGAADIHRTTAREILGLATDDEVTVEQRRIGKTINFGVIYGMGAYRLSRELQISLRQAEDYIESYFRRYARVREFFAQQEAMAKQHGYVETMFGRKRFIAEIDTTGRDDAFLQRVAMNAPVQGSAADLMKLAMIRLAQRIERERLPMEIILQIHDELVVECQSERAEELAAIVRSDMEQAAQLEVPLVVEVGMGKDWLEAHG